MSIYRSSALAIAIALTFPLLLTHYAPLVDYPNHLARAFILRHYGDIPSFSAEYGRSLTPIPNVAMDVIVVGLQYVLPPVAAGKVFLLGVVLLWCWGCHLLGRALHGGRPTWLALPCMLLAYHGAFQYGFVNYAFGLGVYLIGSALWLGRRRNWTLSGLALVTTVAVLAYLSHLSSYALLGVTAVVVTLYDLARDRTTIGRALVSGVPFVPPLLLFAAFMRGGGRIGRVEWNTAVGKAVAVFSVVRGYHLWFDVAVVAGLLAVVVATLVAVRRVGRLSVDGAGLAASLVLFALFLLCPKDLFTSGGADVRVVPAALVLVVLSCHIDLPKRLAAPLLAAAIALLMLRTAALATTWLDLDVRIGRAVALLDRLPVGARMLELFSPHQGADSTKRDRVFGHVPYYAIITRQAYVPGLFAAAAQQPIVARNFSRESIAGDEIFDRHLGEFGYVWAFNPPPETEARLRQCCDLIAADVGVGIWRNRTPRVATYQ